MELRFLQNVVVGAYLVNRKRVEKRRMQEVFVSDKRLAKVGERETAKTKAKWGCLIPKESAIPVRQGLKHSFPGD